MECIQCSLHFYTWICKTEIEALYHLLDHRKVGHRVPDRAIERLIREIKQEDPEFELYPKHISFVDGI